MADPLQDTQKQRLLQPDSPRTSDSPRSSAPLRPGQLQPLSNYSPRQMQLPQQLQPDQQQQQQQQQRLPQQLDQSDQLHWQHQQPSPSQPQAFEVMSQQPGVDQSSQNGSTNSQQSTRPKSASFAEGLVSDSQSQTQSASQASDMSSRPMTATASSSPRVTNEQAFATITAKNVSWQVYILPWLFMISMMTTCILHVKLRASHVSPCKHAGFRTGRHLPCSDQRTDAT